MPKKESQTTVLQSQYSNILVLVGWLLLGIGLCVFLAIYHDVIFEELSYLVMPPARNAVVLSAGETAKGKKIIRPVDEQYGIVIPKIGANTRVISGVSPFNEKEYQIKLTKGVAKARDTADPGEYGNTFIFAHSAGNLNIANRYNAVFYLLSKMEKKDSIYLFYKGKKFVYSVTSVRTVSSDALEYLKQDTTKKQLTLMTCWPPGTTFKRLIVRADLSE